MQRVKVLLADDHRFIRQALGLYIREHTGRFSICECDNGAEAIDRVIKNRPDIVVMDINMPYLSGLQAIEKIKEIAEATRIIVFSMYAQADKVKAAFEKGAWAYVTKNSDSTEVLKAMEEVLAGRKYYCEEIKTNLSDLFFNDHLKPRNAPGSLSRREKEIVSLIKQGHSTTEISRQLGISKNTVGVYRNRIRKKMNVKTMSALTSLLFNEDFE